MIPEDIIIIETKEEMRKRVADLRKEGKTIGFVPTMGFLHEGHLNLVQRAREQCDIVVVSIYVNPAQFGRGEDFSRYPRDVSRDVDLLKKYKTDYVFIPEQETMYTGDHLTWIEVEQLQEKLCGKTRIGHFRGVTTIVLKLLNITIPDLMFMGEKDYQQVVILEKMLSDLDSPVKIVRCPTVRENGGLAMSSRNSYLSPEQRESAKALYQSLLHAREMFRQGKTDAVEVIEEMREMIEDSGGRIDYIEIVDSKTLEEIPYLVKGCRIALAVFYEWTRLIDNIEIC